jgi:hypothetical protein
MVLLPSLAGEGNMAIENGGRAAPQFKSDVGM